MISPPLAPLRALLSRLERERLPHALGGSGLLAALGLVDQVNDWDVTVDAAIATLDALFADVPHERFGNGGGHADHKLTFRESRVELIARFAFFTPDGIVRIPTVVTGDWQGVPLGSPSGWAAAYALLGEIENDDRRRERAASLFGWLERHGADAAGVRALLAEPLPPALRERIAGLSAAPPPTSR